MIWAKEAPKRAYGSILTYVKEVTSAAVIIVGIVVLMMLLLLFLSGLLTARRSPSTEPAPYFLDLSPSPSGAGQTHLP